MIVVMFGHGGKDPGAVGFVKEADETHETGGQIIAEINRLGGKAIGVSSTSDLRVGIANVNKVSTSNDVLLVIHMNGGVPSANGFESYYAQGFYSGKTKMVVDGVHSAMAKVCMAHGMRNRGIKSDSTTRFGRLGALQDTKPSAVLIELGFVSNSLDAFLLEDPTFERDISQALARELMRLDGQTVIEPVIAQPKPAEPLQYYRIRKSWEDAKSQIYAFTDLSKAMATVKLNPGYSLYNPEGVLLYPLPVAVEPPLTNDELRKIRIVIKDVK